MKKQLQLDSGIFTMDFIDEVDKVKNLEEQKEKCFKRILESKATESNKIKVKKIVEDANNSTQLIFAIYNC